MCYQAFALAKLRLNEKIALHKNDGLPLAIVTDIDESIVDNSPQQVHDILHHITYTEKSWKELDGSCNADALAGAVEFFQYADKMGIQCFYVSNRGADERAASIKNLLDVGLPQADTLHVMMKDTTADKESRRAIIRQQFNIALLIDDNLNDFDKMFYKQPSYARCNLVRDNSDLFRRYFYNTAQPDVWRLGVSNMER